MKTKNLFVAVILITTVLFTSCSSVLNKPIQPETIEKEVQLIKEKYPKLDSTKLKILTNLITINKGRKAFVSEFKSKINDENISIDNIIVNEKKFNEIKDNIFNYFKAHKITYNQLLSEVDTVNMIDKRYDIKERGIYKQIDEFCKKKQKEVDEREIKAKLIKDSLNKMVDIKIIGINKTEYDYQDVVEVKILMKNKTSKPIEAISFNLELTDKLGNKIATLGCKSNQRFVKSTVGYWTYNKWDDSDIYDALKNMRLSYFTTKQEISKINLGGKLISAEPNSAEQLINFYYETPKILTGYCPYLDKNDELSIKLKEFESQKKKEIELSTPIISKYQEMTKEFFDLSKLLN
jgi:hypothetical protein